MKGHIPSTITNSYYTHLPNMVTCRNVWFVGGRFSFTFLPNLVMHTSSTVCLFLLLLLLPSLPASVDNTTRFTVYDKMIPFGISGAAHVRLAEVEVRVSVDTSGGCTISPGTRGIRGEGEGRGGWGWGGEGKGWEERGRVGRRGRGWGGEGEGGEERERVGRRGGGGGGEGEGGEERVGGRRWGGERIILECE